ncbi:cytochrome c [Mameliella alba]|nr:cytochrome c [Antarctobacter heliothermus]MBY6146307.1 cytochrome c [Mameliella alba]MCA0955705.1 cytochrome c [Mameliella alba]
MKPLVFALLGIAALPAMAAHELDGRDIDAGARLYAENCAACHGAGLEGQPDWQTPGADGVMPAPPHDETGHTWHHGNVQLFDYTKLGGAELVKRMGLSSFNSGMPGFGDVLSDEEIWQILAYIRSTWPEEIRQIQAGRNPPHD